MQDNSLSSLSPENWPFSLEWLPLEACMVGGAVRDALLSRRSEYLDLDFVLPDGAVKIARAIARHYKAGFVLLDAERQIARVVFPHATADFAQQEGDLETDLRRRDFTINAIAYNPHTQEIIDPLQGCDHLQRRIISMVSASNLRDDPLRLLRGYRQAAQLSFTIDSETQSTIRLLAPHLAQVAAERVRVEIGYLLNTYSGNSWLAAAWEDGLIKSYFQKQIIVAQLEAVDLSAVILAQTWDQLGVQLAQCVREKVKTTWLSIAKLCCLVSQNPEQAEAELMQLTLSRAEIRGVTTALKLLPLLKKVDQMSLREQYFLFKTAGAVFPSIAVLAVASVITVDAISPLINRYLDPDDPVAHPQNLITGTDLIQTLQIPASPLLGKLLTEIALAQIEGKISTRASAIALASQLIESSDPRLF